MTRAQKNSWYFRILDNEKFDMTKNFFELNFSQIAKLQDIAGVMNIKPQDGKSKARTLWDRAKEGLPF